MQHSFTKKSKQRVMKKMLCLAFVLITLQTAVVAQKVRVGAKAGLNLSEVRTNDKEENKEIGIRPSIHAGLVFDININKNLSFQPQVLYSGRGANEDHEDHKDIYKFNSIELPLNLLYRSGNKSGSFFIGGGPSIGYNLSGSLEATDDPNENFDFEFGSGDGEIRRIDLGVNVLAGYELKNGLFFSANYTRGLTNWLNVSTSTWRNNNLGVSVGYFFGKKK